MRKVWMIIVLGLIIIILLFLKYEKKERQPMEAQWQSEDIKYLNDDTIYYKNYYDNFIQGKIMDISFPEINIQTRLEEYFKVDDNIIEGMDTLSSIFFDNRTIEMKEEALKKLFYSHGYNLYLHEAAINDLHIRLIEIEEIDGLSLYPSRILIQTWDDKHIYLEDITGPIPRKVRSFLVIDDKEELRLVIHSSGVSVDYISEEELSFWIFRGSYWILAPMELEIDTSHAHNAGDLYPDLDRNNLFVATFYQDGIAYRSSIQDISSGACQNTYRLGIMEEIEKNKSFKLVGNYENMGETCVDSSCYIRFIVK